VQNIIVGGVVNYNKVCHSGDRSPLALCDCKDIVIVINGSGISNLVSGFMVVTCSRMSSDILPLVMFHILNGFH
jgi:hypothetical protein